MATGCLVKDDQDLKAEADLDGLVHYDEELARVSQDLEAKLDTASRRPDAWLPLERVASAYLSRAKLTGAFDDYLTSQQVLASAFELAGEHEGPALTRAMLNAAIHRLDDVETDLVKAENVMLLDATTIQHINGLRADTWFNAGQYQQAREAFLAMESSHPDVVTATRLAHYHAHTGQYHAAERWFREAEQRVVGRSSHLRSWLKLQFGILDLQRGRLDEARDHYLQGLAIFPGFWLIEEHIAEIDALQGHNELAETSYRDLVARTGSPLFMSALASVLSESPELADQKESIEWQERATAAYEAQYRDMPELVSGHALEHMLHSANGDRALQLARYNYRLRPNGHSALLLVQAHAVVDDVIEAMAVLKPLLTSPYRSAELHATASLLYGVTGDTTEAQAHRVLALAMSPLAFDDIQWLEERRMATYH